jgi:cell division protein FtsI (penicillin-binding protein 3)
MDPLGSSDRPDEAFERAWRGRLKTRVLIVVGALALWSIGIEARLVDLQVFQHAEMADRARQQQQQGHDVPAKRGEIVDRNGEILAYSIDASFVYAMPREMKKPAETAAAVCQALGGCSPADQTWIDRFKNHAAYAVVRHQITPDAEARLRALKLDGIGFDLETKRYYPKMDLAAHVIGFVGAENKGLAGIESKYDAVITGRPGRTEVEVDAKHHVVETRVHREPTAGATVELTIDQYLQHIVERELQAGVTGHHAQSGAAVVMDPKTGEILALANYPTFNPNAPGRFRADDFTNRAVENLYEPGSTFKIVTVSAAIEEGVMKPGDMVDCNPGYITIGKRVIKDAEGHNHGLIPFEEVVVLSSNVGAAKIGLKIGPERLSRYVHRFGFGEALSPDFPGQTAGIVWDPSKMNDSAVASVSMGYQVGVTPLQMAAAVSAVANGGTLFEPHVVRALIRDGERQPVAPKALRRAITADTAASVTEIMEAVTERGTGKRAQLASYQVAGKTGTAQKLIDHHYSDTAYNASFVGFVPSRQPALTIVVLIDTPKGEYFGGEVAAPIFQRIAEASLQRLGVPATINPTPPVIVATGAAPLPARATRGTPLTATAMPVGGQALVPDVRGLSARDALRIMSHAGLSIRVVGSGLVQQQTPAAGAPLERGSVGVLQLSRDPNASGPGVDAPPAGARPPVSIKSPDTIRSPGGGVSE